MDDFADMDFMDSGANGPEASVRNFYEKIQELQHTWIPLEEYYYRVTKMGSMALDKLLDYFKDYPILNYFHCTQARNGGPIGKHL